MDLLPFCAGGSSYALAGCSTRLPVARLIRITAWNKNLFAVLQDSYEIENLKLKLLDSFFTGMLTPAHQNVLKHVFAQLRASEKKVYNQDIVLSLYHSHRESMCGLIHPGELDLISGILMQGIVLTKAVGGAAFKKSNHLQGNFGPGSDFLNLLENDQNEFAVVQPENHFDIFTMACASSIELAETSLQTSGTCPHLSVL